jgi:hypothetical protein
MERGSRKRSSSARSEKMERVGDREKWRDIVRQAPRRYPNFDVVVGLVWSHDPKSDAGGSVCYW